MPTSPQLAQGYLAVSTRPQMILGKEMLRVMVAGKTEEEKAWPLCHVPGTIRSLLIIQGT